MPMSLAAQLFNTTMKLAKMPKLCKVSQSLCASAFPSPQATARSFFPEPQSITSVTIRELRFQSKLPPIPVVTEESRVTQPLCVGKSLEYYVVGTFNFGNF